jgi:hypothetical protein
MVKDVIMWKNSAITASVNCHFEDYLAQDLRIIWRAAPAPCGRRLVRQTVDERSSPTKCPGILG